MMNSGRHRACSLRADEAAQYRLNPLFEIRFKPYNCRPVKKPSRRELTIVDIIPPSR
jgi:hypothetical protein